MAVLVAIVEHSVHHEAQLTLNQTYLALGMPIDTNFEQDEAKLVIEIYMSVFVMNTNMSAKPSTEALLRQTSRMGIFYPTWPRAQVFFDKISAKHLKGQNIIGFSLLSDIIKEIVDTFGTFHGKQCQGLKQTLQDLERQNSMGCIRLPDFYEKGLKRDTNWLFVESQDYLRHIGVLDETHPLNPSVLSANYINSPTNCLQPSGYYMVCCHNECDDILGQLEKNLMAPSSTPERILQALSQIKLSAMSPSFGSLKAEKQIAALRFRLEEVAEYNGGRVPIHGRLFAQWLHHVYPRECPYPHVSGTKNPQWMDDFEMETGKSSQFNEDEMASIVQNAFATMKPQSNNSIVNKLSANFGSCAPWQDQEELFAPPSISLPLHALENDPHVWQIGGAISCAAAVVALTVTLARTCRTLVKVKFPSKMLHV
jgi:hypothetical protein